MSCNSIEVNSSFKVDAHIQRWTITNDDIYLLRFHEAPPGWLDDIIQDVIDDTGLADDLEDLDYRFTNFQEGYTEHFYDWKDGDTETLAYVFNIYATRADMNAGLQEIRTAYVSRDESGAMFDSLIGAWQTGSGGAWFNEQVSVVSNVAYAAAKSASTLTATMESQQKQLETAFGDIEILQKQVDGRVSTWFMDFDPMIGNTIDPTKKPYYCWLQGNTCTEPEYEDSSDKDTRPEHVGDVFVQYELMPDGVTRRILKTMRFTSEEQPDGSSLYKWEVFDDDLASKAYNQALNSQAVADKKVETFISDNPPYPNQYGVSDTDDIYLADKLVGDIWYDSDNKYTYTDGDGQTHTVDSANKMYRYSKFNGSAPYDYRWTEVSDKRLTASVQRLDEATVSINGVARAKSSLVVDADGVTSGYVASADNSTWSEFKVFADKFSVAASGTQKWSGRPFTIDNTVTPPVIKFNGVVEFSNITGGESIVTKDNLEYNIDNNVTTIDGGNVNLVNLNAANITTGYLRANRINAGSIWSTDKYTMEINLDAGYIHIK